MAILVESDTSATVLPLETRARIAFHVSGIALLTIFINGTAITPFYHWLEVYAEPKHRSLLLHRALTQAEILSKNQSRQMKRHWFFHNCNFEILEMLVPQLHRLFKSGSAASVSNLSESNKAQITDKRIQKLMMQLASMLNIDKENRYRAKILFASELASVRGLSLCTQRELLNATDLRDNLYHAQYENKIVGGSKGPTSGTNLHSSNNGGGGINHGPSDCNFQSSNLSLAGGGGGQHLRGQGSRPGVGSSCKYARNAKTPLVWSGKKKNFEFPLKSQASVLEGLCNLQQERDQTSRDRFSHSKLRSVAKELHAELEKERPDSVEMTTMEAIGEVEDTGKSSAYSAKVDNQIGFGGGTEVLNSSSGGSTSTTSALVPAGIGSRRAGGNAPAQVVSGRSTGGIICTASSNIKISANSATVSVAASEQSAVAVHRPLSDDEDSDVGRSPRGTIIEEAGVGREHSDSHDRTTDGTSLPVGQGSEVVVDGPLLVARGERITARSTASPSRIDRASVAALGRTSDDIRRDLDRWTTHLIRQSCTAGDVESRASQEQRQSGLQYLEGIEALQPGVTDAIIKAADALPQNAPRNFTSILQFFGGKGVPLSPEKGEETESGQRGKRSRHGSRRLDAIESSFDNSDSSSDERKIDEAKSKGAATCISDDDELQVQGPSTQINSTNKLGGPAGTTTTCSKGILVHHKAGDQTGSAECGGERKSVRISVVGGLVLPKELAATSTPKNGEHGNSQTAQVVPAVATGTPLMHLPTDVGGQHPPIVEGEPLILPQLQSLTDLQGDRDSTAHRDGPAVPGYTPLPETFRRYSVSRCAPSRLSNRLSATQFMSPAFTTACRRNSVDLSGAAHGGNHEGSSKGDQSFEMHISTSRDEGADLLGEASDRVSDMKDTWTNRNSRNDGTSALQGGGVGAVGRGSVTIQMSLLNVRQAITHDINTAAELYQTILDGSIAGYTELYELELISELAYRALMESFEYAQEAVQGELQGYDFLRPHFPELHEQSHRVQTEASLEVFWECLLHSLEHGVGMRWKASKWMSLHFGHCWSERTLLRQKWLYTKRQFEAIFSFIIVNETLIEELPVFDDFPHIKNSLNHLLEQAIAENLYHLHKTSPEIFIMMEHVLAARLLLINKRVTLQHLEKEGVMKSQDVTHILSTVVEPSFKKLTHFIPDMAMMDLMKAISNPGMQLSF
ncbi:unnamed protein product [Amoebophrya sp. A25]|nr:unnamed protein product [Amoebophrya sp. A25]|eukprot:GSA25T00004768001.1